MSTINNIPFDINRIPAEKNAVAKKEGLKPLYSSEAIHQAEEHNPSSERRKRKERREKSLKVAKDRRRLIQRRQANHQANIKSDPLEQKPGSIIDFEV